MVSDTSLSFDTPPKLMIAVPLSHPPMAATLVEQKLESFGRCSETHVEITMAREEGFAEECYTGLGYTSLSSVRTKAR